MLTAVGLWGDGHGERLSWPLATAEDAASWGTCVGPLSTKGRTEQTTQRISSAGAKGLEKALYSPLYGVPHQRGRFHKIKNSAAHVPSAELRGEAGEPAAAVSRQAPPERQQAIFADAGHLYASAVEGEIRARAVAFRDTWEEREPQAVAAFLRDVAHTVSYLSGDFPRAHVSLIRPTNLLERFQQEIRRTQRDIGMLQSEAGCDVLWYMVAMRDTAKQRAACRGKG